MDSGGCFKINCLVTDLGLDVWTCPVLLIFDRQRIKNVLLDFIGPVGTTLVAPFTATILSVVILTPEVLFSNPPL